MGNSNKFNVGKKDYIYKLILTCNINTSNKTFSNKMWCSDNFKKEVKRIVDSKNKEIDTRFDSKFDVKDFFLYQPYLFIFLLIANRYEFIIKELNNKRQIFDQEFSKLFTKIKLSYKIICSKISLCKNGSIEKETLETIVSLKEKLKDKKEIYISNVLEILIEIKLYQNLKKLTVDKNKKIVELAIEDTKRFYECIEILDKKGFDEEKYIKLQIQLDFLEVHKATINNSKFSHSSLGECELEKKNNEKNIYHKTHSSLEKKYNEKDISYHETEIKKYKDKLLCAADEYKKLFANLVISFSNRDTPSISDIKEIYKLLKKEKKKEIKKLKKIKSKEINPIFIGNNNNMIALKKIEQILKYHDVKKEIKEKEEEEEEIIKEKKKSEQEEIDEKEEIEEFKILVNGFKNFGEFIESINYYILEKDTLYKYTDLIKFSKKVKIYKGGFKKNKKNGVGREYVGENERLIFYGKFLNNMRNGCGNEALYDENGEFLDEKIGHWKDGKFKNELKNIPHNDISEDITKITKSIDKDENLKDKYILGNGGFACIYKYESKEGYNRAFKYFESMKREKDVDKLEVFKKEIKTMCTVIYNLKHDNIIKMFSICLKHPVYGIEMERCETSVYEYIGIDKKDKPKISFEKKIDMLLQTANGMKYLHENHIMHRDLDWKNVLLIENTIKIIDFNGSKIVKNSHCSDFGKNETAIGKIGNKAPERGERKCYYQSDVYSFGIMIYELLTQKDALKIDYNKLHPVVDIKKKIQNNVRPDVKDIKNEEKYPEFLESIKKLMIHCWDGDYEKRPLFPSIYEKLQSINKKVNGKKE